MTPYLAAAVVWAVTSVVVGLALGRYFKDNERRSER